MIYLRIKEILKEKQKTKYWLVKEMDVDYKSISNLMDCKSSSIRFKTLEKMCKVLDCEPGDILCLKKTRRRKKKNG